MPDALGRFRNRYRALAPRDTPAQLIQPRGDIPLDVDTGLGQRQFAKASVSCGLRSKHTKWGIYGQRQAAIWQLFIDASQPLGYKLSEIIVEMSFLEADPGQAVNANVASQPILTILEPPSPKIIHGGSTLRHQSRQIRAEPQIDAGGVGFGGVGLSTSSETDIHSCWQFRSHRHFNDQGRYTTAKWIWEANKDNPQVETLGPLFAGVVIQYPSQPFYVSCNVYGKLLNATFKRFKISSEGKNIAQISRIVPPVSDEPEDITTHAECLESVVRELILSE